MPVHDSQPVRRRVKTSLKRADVEKLIRNLPAMISGSIPSRFGLHKLFWGAVAFSMFTDIHDAFEVKAYGLPDELGNQWDDLSQHTKAYKRPVERGQIPNQLYRRLKKNAPARMKGHGSKAHDPTRAQTGLGLLSPGEYRRWQILFNTIYQSSRHRMTDREAKSLAGQVAWTRLKEQGAETMWNVLGNRQGLLILRKSDRLMESLHPGRFDPNIGYYKYNKDQVYVLSRGKIEIGTYVEYAQAVSEQRPIWPDEMGSWIDRAVSYGRDAIMNKVANILQTSTSLNPI